MITPPVPRSPADVGLSKVTMLAFLCITALICTGCVTKPLDISGVASEAELDRYLGKRVMFTGEWQDKLKAASISNGHVFISPDLAFWEGSHSYCAGARETVTGYLTKRIVEEPPRAQFPVAIPYQAPLPGDYYYIMKAKPNVDSIVRRMPPPPRKGGGNLLITSTVPGADIKVEGVDAGTIGPHEELRIDHLPEGAALIEVFVQECEPWTWSAEIKEGELTQVTANPRRLQTPRPQVAGCPTAKEHGAEPRPGEERTFAGIQFVWIPPGTFMMGSPVGEEGRDEDEALHRVTLTRGFWLGKYEVTQAQWKAVIGCVPSTFKGSSLPVDGVSRYDCEAFLRNLNQRDEGIFRLPTEAEWEYACRAGTSTAFSFGDAEEELENHAWYEGNSEGQTHPVGQKRPNAWGLHDMDGNLMEWCQDLYGEYSSGPVTDPTGAATGSEGVVRGGAWFSGPSGCRAAFRYPWTTGLEGRDNWWGFRLLRTQD
ncbi:MAG: formylglycine-generating enzyme family protein [Candidatus Hydrogenedentes bacterium]|nr:formylglycine-generating enzyme family protein [Candidatus Hydrogenedentota bacterium]